MPYYYLTFEYQDHQKLLYVVDQLTVALIVNSTLPYLETFQIQYIVMNFINYLFSNFPRLD